MARIDPLTHSTAGKCLSDHVHRFYGAAGAGALRPEARWRDLRKAAGNTGNVRENKSLYWNPAIYKVLHPDDSAMRRFELVDAWFASSYYVWRGGDEEVTAFPNGFKMRATGADLRSRPVATCAPDPEDCERTDAGGCDAWEPSDQAGHGFLPVAACWELEISIVFPTCWDGERKEAADGSHVAFAEDCEQDSDECFDFDCPDTHPVRLPELPVHPGAQLRGRRARLLRRVRRLPQRLHVRLAPAGLAESARRVRQRQRSGGELERAGPCNPGGTD